MCKLSIEQFWFRISVFMTRFLDNGDGQITFLDSLMV